MYFQKNFKTNPCPPFYILILLYMVMADIVMHSATKFIAGHSDIMAGVLAVKGER